MIRSIKTLTCLLLGLMALLPGCLRRRMIVRSNPPGAMAYVDNQQIGTTPCSADFTYYGTREIRLVKPGFETLTVNQPIPAPWYEYPPLDFVSENLVPREIQDYRTLSYNLVPQVIVPTDQLLSRAEHLRQTTAQGAVLPATATGVPGTLATPGTLGPPTLVAPPETVPTPAPQPEVLQPRTSGNGVIPPGGLILDPLPAPQQ